MDVKAWLVAQAAQYEFAGLGVYQESGPMANWPVHATGPRQLTEALEAGGHLLPLPREPAALANVLEVSMVDHLVVAAEQTAGAEVQRGTERGYPDLELSGEAFGGGHHAVDIKVARRAINKRGEPTGMTQSRITLYTGNTFFRYPTLHWPA